MRDGAGCVPVSRENAQLRGRGRDADHAVRRVPGAGRGLGRYRRRGVRRLRCGSGGRLCDELALELSDLQVMIFKLAYQCGIDMETALRRGQAKADARFPDPAAGPADRAAYWQRFRTFVAEAGLDD